MKPHSVPAVSARRASEALIALLGQISSMRQQNVRIDFPKAEPPIDLLARVTVFGRSYTLACALWNNSLDTVLLTLHGTARARDNAARAVLIAPHLSPESQDLCRQSGIDYLDLTGNARLELDEVFLAHESLPELHASLPSANLLPPEFAVRSAGLSGAAA
jgi:hypothetical protein